MSTPDIPTTIEDSTQNTVSLNLQTNITTITVNLSVISDPHYTLPFLQLLTPSGARLNALVDSGATTSLIAKPAVLRLRCPVHYQKLVNFRGFISSSGPQQVKFYKLDIMDKSGKAWSTILPEYPQLPTVVKAPTFSQKNLEYLIQKNFDQQQLTGLQKFNGKPIDLIIGNNVLPTLLSTSTRHVLPSGRIVEDTQVGVITHPSPVPDALQRATETQDDSSDQNNDYNESYINTIDMSDYDRPEELSVEISQSPQVTNARLDWLLEQSWKLEVLGIEPPTAILQRVQLNQDLILKYKKTAILDKDNKLYVQFPFNGKEATLHDNYLVAVKRLISLLEVQLASMTDRATYNNIIQQQLISGIIELVPENEQHIGPHYYIPHRVVIKPDAQNTKLRIVLDASSHMKNEQSLNQCIHPGPSILKSILGILFRSRTKPYLMIADLEKAFHQVRLQPQHRNCTKFLWLKDHTKPATPDNIVTYRFTRLPFGITASPFLLAITILRYMELNPHPIHEKITQNLYVDNVMFTPESTEELLKNYQESVATFSSMHMRLRDYLCNNKTVMNAIPEEDRSKSTICKLLGHHWDANKDTLTIKIAQPPEGIPTKRQLASFIASTYDPQGLISPLGVASKSLMAKVWKYKLKWKDPLPTTLLSDWEKIKAAITAKSYTVPRRITPAQGFTNASLVMFSDASKDHYATCAYLRFECQDNTTQVQLLFSKTRIKPMNNEHLTIPRMELLGVLTAVNAASTILTEVNITLSSITFFCDNTAVLNWVQHKNSSDKWVSNRVRAITELEQEFTKKKLSPTFRYVATDKNPADIASRGATLQQIKESNLWQHGPEFLLQDQAYWPKSLEQSPEDPKEFHFFTLDTSAPPFPPHRGLPSEYPPHTLE
ncbi:hypothetical protein CRE_27987, partial [Caenorhabditis remanei]